MDKAQPSPDARAVGAGAASLTVALLVCLFTYFLRAVDFAPLRALIIEEDHLYDVIRPPDVRPLKNAHRVVFIDIDDGAVTKWNTPDNGPPPSAPLPNDTPRKLIARLAGFARDAHAKVIFLDFDFRDSLPDDSALHDELAQTNKPPILIPTFFTSGRLPGCDEQMDARPPMELATAFSDLVELPKDPPPGSDKGLPSIALVHPLLTLGAYGLPEGVCSSYRVRFGYQGELVWREAAMARAVELAIADSPPCDPADHCIKPVDLAHPELLSIRWTIGSDTDQKYGRSDNSAPSNDAKENGNSDKMLVYARVKAAFLVKYQGLLDPSAEQLDVLKDAIVVIGTTAPWSEDTLVTPLGDLQGVLAHVNFALSLQSFDDEAPTLLQFALDLAFIFVATVVAVFAYWRPKFRALARKGALSARQRLSRLFSEAGVFVICGLFFALGSAALLASGFRFLAGWRFGVLSFIVGSIVGLMIEICSAVADTAREWAEDCMTPQTHELAKTPRHEESVGSPPETLPP
jgi:CHASE2 domain-containing sensor protein